MDDQAIDIDFVIQALMIFEGLSLWKLSHFVENHYPASTVGMSYQQAKKQKWEKLRNSDDPSAWQFIKLLTFCFCMLLKNLFSCLTWLLKWTPYLVSLVFIVVVYLYAFKLVPDCLDRNFFIWASFIFIGAKLTVNCMSLLLNCFIYKSIEQDLPKEQMLSGNLSEVK